MIITAGTTRMVMAFVDFILERIMLYRLLGNRACFLLNALKVIYSYGVSGRGMTR